MTHTVDPGGAAKIEKTVLGYRIYNRFILISTKMVSKYKSITLYYTCLDIASAFFESFVDLQNSEFSLINQGGNFS